VFASELTKHDFYKEFWNLVNVFRGIGMQQCDSLRLRGNGTRLTNIHFVGTVEVDNQYGEFSTTEATFDLEDYLRTTGRHRVDVDEQGRPILENVTVRIVDRKGRPYVYLTDIKTGKPVRRKAPASVEAATPAGSPYGLFKLLKQHGALDRAAIAEKIGTVEGVVNRSRGERYSEQTIQHDITTLHALGLIEQDAAGLWRLTDEADANYEAILAVLQNPNEGRPAGSPEVTLHRFTRAMREQSVRPQIERILWWQRLQGVPEAVQRLEAQQPEDSEAFLAWLDDFRNSVIAPLYNAWVIEGFYQASKGEERIYEVYDYFPHFFGAQKAITIVRQGRALLAAQPEQYAFELARIDTILGLFIDELIMGNPKLDKLANQAFAAIGIADNSARLLPEHFVQLSETAQRELVYSVLSGLKEDAQKAAWINQINLSGRMEALIAGVQKRADEAADQDVAILRAAQEAGGAEQVSINLGQFKELSEETQADVLFIFYQGLGEEAQAKWITEAKFGRSTVIGLLTNAAFSQDAPHLIQAWNPHLLQGKAFAVQLAEARNQVLQENLAVPADSSAFDVIWTHHGINAQERAAFREALLAATDEAWQAVLDWLQAHHDLGGRKLSFLDLIYLQYSPLPKSMLAEGSIDSAVREQEFGPILERIIAFLKSVGLDTSRLFCPVFYTEDQGGHGGVFFAGADREHYSIYGALTPGFISVANGFHEGGHAANHNLKGPHLKAEHVLKDERMIVEAPSMFLEKAAYSPEFLKSLGATEPQIAAAQVSKLFAELYQVRKALMLVEFEERLHRDGAVAYDVMGELIGRYMGLPVGVPDFSGYANLNPHIFQAVGSFLTYPWGAVMAHQLELALEEQAGTRDPEADPAATRAVLEALAHEGSSIPWQESMRRARPGFTVQGAVADFARYVNEEVQRLLQMQTDPAAAQAAVQGVFAKYPGVYAQEEASAVKMTPAGSPYAAGLVFLEAGDAGIADDTALAAAITALARSERTAALGLTDNARGAEGYAAGTVALDRQALNRHGLIEQGADRAWRATAFFRANREAVLAVLRDPLGDDTGRQAYRITPAMDATVKPRIEALRTAWQAQQAQDTAQPQTPVALAEGEEELPLVALPVPMGLAAELGDPGLDALNQRVLAAIAAARST
jgi:hypothetical protein